jgi:hypothetical protein
MVRWVSLSSLVALLGLGGFALAQEGLIVDPWAHPSSTPSSDVRSPNAAKDQALGHASTAALASKAGPSVVPVGPPLAARANAGVIPLGPVGEHEIIDPWASAASHPADSDRRSRLRLARHDWAWEIQEIVDPWAKGPIVAVTDPAIVDPWAH